MTLEAQIKLNEHLIKWDATIRQFDTAVQALARTKSDYEYRVAVLRVKAKHEDPKVSLGFLDSLVDADDDGHRLALEYRAADATVEALKARLRWCSAVSDALRSEVSTERAEALLYKDVDLQTGEVR